MIQFIKACGNLNGIPDKLPRLTSEVFLLIEIAIPILLVIMGTLDLFKGITANKEDEIAKGRKMFFKRLATAALVFFIISITKLIVSFLDGDNSLTLTACMDCFINNKCDTKEKLEYEKQHEEYEKNYSEWTCTLKGIEFKYVYSNNGDYVLEPNSKFVSLDSKFKPKNTNECPSEKDYAVSYDKKASEFAIITKTEADSITWKCTIGEYSFKYKYLSNKPTFVANEQEQGRIPVSGSESEFVPQYVYACPVGDEYKVISQGAPDGTVIFKIVENK